MRGATLVPLEVAECTARLQADLSRLAAAAPSKVASDVTTAEALAEACLKGALANVRINLVSLAEGEFRNSVEARTAAVGGG